MKTKTMPKVASSHRSGIFMLYKQGQTEWAQYYFDSVSGSRKYILSSDIDPVAFLRLFPGLAKAIKGRVECLVRVTIEVLGE